MATKKEKIAVEGTVTRVADGKVYFRPKDPGALRTLILDGPQGDSHRAGLDEIAVRVPDVDAYKVGADETIDVDVIG